MEVGKGWQRSGGLQGSGMETDSMRIAAIIDAYLYGMNRESK